MQTCHLRGILLDFGGVLAEEGFAEGMKAIARENGLDEAVIWRAGLQAVWDSGYVSGRSDEAAFWRLFKERTGLVGDEAHWREDILSRFTVRAWMPPVVERLRGMGLTTAILSDQTDWLALLDSRQDFFKYFDVVLNSYHHGMTKQEPEFFLLALRETGLAPEETLFVDDNPGNVERALALGFKAHLYVDREGFEAELARLCPGALGR